MWTLYSPGMETSCVEQYTDESILRVLVAFLVYLPEGARQDGGVTMPVKSLSVHLPQPHRKRW